MEDWVSIKALKKKRPAMSLRSIAKLIGISHHTVQRALVRTDPPVYKRKVRSNSELEPFREIIAEMTNAKHFRGSRILEELRSKGYTGGKTAFYRMLSDVRIENRKHCTPYHTAPGEQSQFDWSPYTVPMGGRATKVIVFSYVNGFSHSPVYDAGLSEDQDTIFAAIEQGFIESGGVPQRLQTDNAKVFVLDASSTHFKWNPGYLRFCAHYGVEPSRSLPGHPWSKGKVEKQFQFLEDHFIDGASFEDFPDFIAKLKAFEHRVNTRVHATIKTTPEELLAMDRVAFSPLPATRYAGGKSLIRKTTSDGLFSFGASRYSVPWNFAGSTIWLRILRGYTLEVYSQANALIATHTLATVKGSLVIDKAHYRMAETTESSIDRIKHLFQETFPGHGEFLEKLISQKRTNARYHLAGILNVARLYHRDDVVRALAIAIEYNIFTVSFFAGYLEKNFQQVFDLSPIYHTTRTDLPENGAVTRDLRDYQLRVTS
jgi:transposase